LLVHEVLTEFFNWSGDEFEKEYLPFAITALRRYGSQGALRAIMKKFPDIKPIDAKRAIKQGLQKIEDGETAYGAKK
jgi:hypothetical protein